MKLILAPSTYYEDAPGQLKGPGETITVSADEGRKLIAGGQALEAETPKAKKEN